MSSLVPPNGELLVKGFSTVMNHLAVSVVAQVCISKLNEYIEYTILKKAQTTGVQCFIKYY
jgi:hypothetical protein